MDHVDQPLVRQGRKLEQARNTVAAEALYRKARASGEPDAAYYLGELLLAHRLTEAAEVLEGAVSEGDIDAHIPLGNAYAALERREDAISHYRLAADAGQAAALHNLGIVLSEMGRLSDAAEAWHESVAAGATDPVDAGHFFADAGILDEAERFFRWAAESGDPEALTDLGAMFQDANRLEEAYQVFGGGGECWRGRGLRVLSLCPGAAGKEQ